jgi:hypothetical protein
MSRGAIVAARRRRAAAILGWTTTTTLVILVPAIIYTMLGGVQAVTWTDVKVMGGPCSSSSWPSLPVANQPDGERHRRPCVLPAARPALPWTRA